MSFGDKSDIHVKNDYGFNIYFVSSFNFVTSLYYVYVYVFLTFIIMNIMNIMKGKDNDMNMIEEYFDYYKQFKCKYGSKIAIFMEVGAFYEAYSIENDYETAGNARELSELMDIKLTKRNGNKDFVSSKNPYVAGVPSYSFQKRLNTLIDHNYTVILINQFDIKGTTKKERKVTNIYSSGTYISNEDQLNNNFLMSVYIEQNVNQNGKQLNCVGITVFDVSTGELQIYEAIDQNDDNNYAFGELSRYINTFNPSECIISSYDDVYTREFLNERLTDDLKNRKTVLHIPENGSEHAETYGLEPVLLHDFKNISYQEKMFNKAFNFDVSHIDNMILARISLCVVLEYCYEHDQQNISKLRKPIVNSSSVYCNLENNCVRQLNLINTHTHNKYNIHCSKHVDMNRADGLLFSTGSNGNGIRYSLLDIIDFTETAMGHRLLQHRLVTPIVKVSELRNRYMIVELIRHLETNTWKGKQFKTFHSNLSQIPDIERLFRKIVIGRIHPYELYRLYNGLECMKCVFDMFVDCNIKVFEQLTQSKHRTTLRNLVNQLTSFVDILKNDFDMNELSRYQMTNIQTNIFNNGVSKKLDTYTTRLDETEHFFTHLVGLLDKLFYNAEINKNKKNRGSVIKTLSDKDDGGYKIQTTEARGIVIMNQIKGLQIKPECLDGIGIVKKTRISKSSKDMLFSSDKINTHKLVHYETMNNMNKVILEIYETKIKEYSSHYDCIMKLCNILSIIDVGQSTYQLATRYNYTRPNIVDTNFESSFVDIVDMRHPIIERLEHSIERYIPQSIQIGYRECNGLKEDKGKENKDKESNVINGVLLFGINASGKSVTMKSIGLCVILAQAGIYVPAKAMTFAPYKNIMVRIEGGDDLYRGMSSFEVEMSELNNILRKHDKNSLIIGDEICHGTETNSAIAIISTAIRHLSLSKCSFIFATHLHQLYDLDTIKHMKNIQSYHIEITYDDQSHRVISRKICKGIGKPMYGIEVCDMLGLDEKFIQDAYGVRNKLVNQPLFVNNKKSNYNKRLYMDECYVCGAKAEHTHHIIPQSTCDTYVHHINNLMPLCKKCHMNIHD